MRAFGCGSVLLTAYFLCGPVLGAPAALPPPVPAEQAPPVPPTPPVPPPPPTPPPPPVPPAPPAPPTPPVPPTPEPPTAVAPAPSASEAAPPAPPPPATAPPLTAPFDERRPATVLAVSGQDAPIPPAAPSRFARNYDALPLTLEARFGLNTRLSSSFDGSAHEQLLDSTFALGAYLAWNPEYALGLELEHAGLGHVRGVSDESSLDAEYSTTGAWLAARVFPWRNERWDVFVNLRLGLVFQHVDALGTRQTSTSITVPPASFSCSESDGPGLGLGGALGAAFRLSHHVSVLSRLDATGERLSGDVLGTCADGIGSVTTISGTLGVAYEFETSH